MQPCVRTWFSGTHQRQLLERCTFSNIRNILTQWWSISLMHQDKIDAALGSILNKRHQISSQTVTSRWVIIQDNNLIRDCNFFIA